ncbi:MAG: GntR family transcriptional regulator, partial [Clostridia bacterium]
MADVRINLVSAVDAVIMALSQDIFSLAFAPGMKLTEADLAERYCVSRNTIRETIAHLVNSGILVKVANRGIYIKKITIQDVRELFHLRKLFELEAVSGIGQRGFIPPTLSAALIELQKADAHQDWGAFVDADAKFHLSLVEAAGSSRLTRLYQTIASEIKLCIAQSRRLLDDHHENMYDHRVIFELLQKNDIEGAANFLARHLDSAVGDFELVFEPHVSGKKPPSARAGRKSGALENPREAP